MNVKILLGMIGLRLLISRKCVLEPKLYNFYKFALDLLSLVF